MYHIYPVMLHYVSDVIKKIVFASYPTM